MTTNRTLKDDIAEYWAARATSFDASPGHGIGSDAERKAWLALVEDRLGALRGCSVLEMASGTGEFTSVLADAGADVTGIDLCEAMLAQARPKLQAAGRRARLFLGDAEDTREPDGHYDAVVCRHLVWTLPEPGRAVADWFRVLRPGGRLLVIDGDWVRLPWLGRLRQGLGTVLVRLMRPLSPRGAPEPIDWAAHKRIMTRVHFHAGLRPGPLADLLRAAGFAGVETGSIAPVRRAQRRAAPFPRSLTVGVYDDFWLSAIKPAR